MCRVPLLAYACGSSLVTTECRCSKKACLRHWTVLECLKIKALSKTRTYLACSKIGDILYRIGFQTLLTIEI